MAEDGHREVAACNIRERPVRGTFADMTATNRNIEGAIVAVKVWILLEHLNETGK